MKAPVLALTVAVAAFAASSVYLWSQLREERARAAQVEATARELNARIAELEKSRVHFAQNRAAGGGLARPSRAVSPRRRMRRRTGWKVCPGVQAK